MAWHGMVDSHWHLQEAAVVDRLHACTPYIHTNILFLGGWRLCGLELGSESMCCVVVIVLLCCCVV
jgi:hypothetical protein